MLYDPFPIGRVCRVCGIWKPGSALRKNKNQPDGVEMMCKVCNREQANRYYAEHADQVKAKLRDEYTKDPTRIKERNRKSREKPENKIKTLARVTKWQAINPEKVRQYKQKWFDTHREQYREIQRQCFLKKREHYLRQRNIYRLAHPEQTKATQRRSNAKRRDKAREFRRQHQMRYRVYAQVRRARIRDLPYTFTETDWQNCLNYWNGRCAICDRPPGLWHTLAQDHWVPVTRGGGYTPDNIMPLCHGTDGCNNSKSDADPAVWLVAKLGKRKAAAKLREIETYFASLIRESE
jgi:hypothetical protein